MALRGTAVPAPEFLAACEDEQVLGAAPRDAAMQVKRFVRPSLLYVLLHILAASGAICTPCASTYSVFAVSSQPSRAA